jgi:hypothetical protein
MPAHVKKIGRKWRVVEPNGKPVKNAAGTSADGGGHTTHGQAVAQAQAINIRQHGLDKKK